MAQYTAKDIAKVRKGMAEAEQRKHDDIVKQTNVAPTYKKLPSLGEVARRKVIDGTDASSMAIQESKKKEQAMAIRKAIENPNSLNSMKQTNNVSNTIPSANYKPESKKYNILGADELDKLNAEASAIQAKGVNASQTDMNRLQEIYDLVDQSNVDTSRKKTDDKIARHNELLSDGRFKNDIDMLNMAQSNDAGTRGRGLRQLKSMGYKNVKEYMNQLSRRYEMTEDELADIALTNQSNQTRAQEQKEAEALYNYGQNHKVGGSALSLVGDLGSAVEGGYNTIAGLISDDERYLSHMMGNIRNVPRQSVTDTIDNGVGKTAYQLAMGVGDLGVGMATGNPALMMAGNTAGDALDTAVNNGSDVRSASMYAAGAGALDYVTNKVGLDKAKELAVESIKSAGWKKFLAQNAIAGAGEAGENVIQDIAQTFLDEVINKENSELNTSYNNKIASGMSEEEAFKETAKEYAAQIGMSAGTGYLMGSAMQGAGTLGKAALEKGAGKILDWKTAKDSKKANNLANNIIEENNQKTDNTVNNLLTKDTQEANNIADTILAEEGKVTNEDVKSIPTMNESSRITRPDVNRIEETANPIESAREVEALRQQVTQPEVQPEVTNAVQPEVPEGRPRYMAENAGLERTNVDEPLRVESEPLETEGFEREGMSRFMTKEAIDSGIYTKEYFDKNRTIQDIAKIAKTSESESLANAMEAVDSPEKAEQWFNKVTKGEYQLGSDANKANTDFDTGMLVLQGLSDALENAKTDADKRALVIQRNALLRKMKDFSHNMAIGLQAHSKWCNTADGAIMAGERLLGEQEQMWKGRNKSKVEGNKQMAAALRRLGDNGLYRESKAETLTHDEIKQGIKAELEREFKGSASKFGDAQLEYLTSLVENKVPIGTITDEIEHFLNHGQFYTLDESTPVTREKSAKLVRALREQGDKTPKKQKTEIGFAKRKERIINTLEDEFGDINGMFTDDAINQLVDFEEKLPTWQLIDEIEHFLQHGEFYEITEDAPENLPKMGALSSMLDRIAGVEKQKTEKTPDTLEDIARKVYNTLNSDSSSIAGQFNDDDIIFIATMFDEGVPKWQIEDEIRYKLENGTWYSLDESIEPARPKNQRLRNSLNSLLGEETAPTEKTVPTYDELREQVRNTLEDEYAGTFDFTDEDVDYIAGMLSQGATKEELADALNTKMATGKFGISAETQEQVNHLWKAMDMVDPESKDYATMQAEAFRLIANESMGDASPLEKFDAWRYLAMLGNPKTMLRNWVGNQMFNVVTGISNNVAALGEEIADRRSVKKTGEHIDRTKAFINPLSKEGRAEFQKAKRDFELKRYVSGAGTKYKDTKSAIEDAKSVFDSKVAQLYEKIVDAGISDTSAVQRKYATSLMGYMKANGLTEADMDASYKYDELNRQSKGRTLDQSEQAELEQARIAAEKMEKARDYALKEAEYATFHEDNAVADFISKVSNSNDVAKVIVDGMVPFKKTPANVLRSGLEYSPLGITKSGYLALKHLKEVKGDYADVYERKRLLHKGTKEVTRTSVNDVIDSWSKSLTGTGLAALGYLLYSKGVLQSSNNDEKYQDQLEGLQNFSIKLNIGGKDRTYTIDWAAPAVMPLLMGAEVKKVMDERAISGESVTPDDVVEIINSVLNPVMETSMLQGVQNTFESAARQLNEYNGTGEAIAGIGGALLSNTATGYVSQAIPTISGQIARTLDGTRRSTDTKHVGIVGEAEKQMRKTMNKIPFLSRLNTPYVDANGRTQSNSPFEYSNKFTDEPVKNIVKGVPNLVYQLTSPGYFQTVEQTDSDKIRREAYNSLDENGKPIKDADVYADWKSTVKVNGEKLTPEQMYTYRTAQGTANREIGDALAKEDWYNKLSGDEKTELLKSTKALTDKIGKVAVDESLAPTNNKAFDAYEKGGIPSLMEYYKTEAHNDAVKNELGSASEFAKEIYDSGNQKRIDKYKEATNIASQYGKDGITKEQFLMYEKYGESRLKKELNYVNKADELDVSNNNTFKALVDKKVPDEQIKKAYDAITSVQIGEDEYGEPKYMTFNEDNYNLYRKYGEQGLKDYQEIESKGADFYTYQQAKKQMPSLSKQSYISTFKSMDGKAGSKADGSISQKELLYYFESKRLTQKEAEKYWNAFGKVSGEDAWKSIPVLKYNKKTGKNEWKTQKK